MLSRLCHLQDSPLFLFLLSVQVPLQRIKELMIYMSATSSISFMKRKLQCRLIDVANIVLIGGIKRA